MIVMDAETIKQAILTLVGTNPNSVFEIRIPKAGRNKTVSGYYDIEHIDTAIKDIESFDGKHNIFFTLNEVNPQLLARTNNSLKPFAESTTSDESILRRRWLLIDCDPKREAGISSTKEEKRKSADKAADIKSFLSSFQYPEPIICDSGNGWHLLYSIDLDNTKGNTDLVKSVLQVLSMKFDDDSVVVDTSVFNPARITKLYGTVAVKGQNIPQRPHRKSSIVKIPDTVETVSMEQLQAVADLFPKPEPRHNSRQQEFNLDDWLNKYNIRVNKKVACSVGVKYILDICPFNNCSSPL